MKQSRAYDILVAVSVDARLQLDYMNAIVGKILVRIMAQGPAQP